MSGVEAQKLIETAQSERRFLVNRNKESYYIFLVSDKLSRPTFWELAIYTPESGKYFLIRRSGKTGYSGRGDIEEFDNRNDAKNNFIDRLSRKISEKLNHWSAKDFNIGAEIGASKSRLRVHKVGIVGEGKDKKIDDVKIDPSILRIIDISRMAAFIDTGGQPIQLSVTSFQNHEKKKLFHPELMEKALKVLDEISEYVKQKIFEPDPRMIKATTTYYSLVPRKVTVRSIPFFRETLVLEKEWMEDNFSISSSISLYDMDSRNAARNLLKKTHIQVISSESDTFQNLKRYIETVKGAAHLPVKLLELFEVRIEEEFNNYKYDGRPSKLLFHGTRDKTVLSILDKGLRLPIIATSGWMFGAGIYFADISSKSANYTSAVNVNSASGEGVLFIYEVYTGKEYITSQMNSVLPQGFDSLTVRSTWTRSTIDPRTIYIDDIGAEYNIGKIETSSTALLPVLYPEYVVYNKDQIRLRYMSIIKTR